MHTFAYSAVLLYYKKGRSVLGTIDGLLDQRPAPTELIFVDNASGDGLADVVEDNYPQIQVVRAESNLGYAGGMNLGRKALSVEVPLLLFATHEVELEPDCVGLLVKAMTDNGIVQAGPVLGLLNRSNVWSAGGNLNWRGGTTHKKLSSGSGVGDATWLDGALHLVRSSAFDDIQGFDEDFFLYWEDVDLSLRLRNRGRVVVVDSARAYQDTSFEPQYYGARNRILLWRKHKRPVKLVISILELATRALRDNVIRRQPPEGHKVSGRFRGLRDGLRCRTTI